MEKIEILNTQKDDEDEKTTNCNTKVSFIENILLSDDILSTYPHKQLIEEFIQNLIYKNSSTSSFIKKKNSVYSEISQKFKNKFPDKKYSIKFFNNIIGGCFNKYSDFTPEEIINDISCLLKIKKTLNFYSTKTLNELILSRNLKVEDQFINSAKLRYYYFEHKVIEDIYNINFGNLKYLLEGPEGLRRPVDSEYGHYRYVPIICKNYCEEICSNFYGELDKENKKEFDNNQQINLTIKKLFLQNCTFSHNYNEINYHPFKFRTKYCKNKICNDDDGEYCYNAHKNNNKEELLYNFILPQFSEIISDLNKIVDNNKNKNITRQINLTQFNGFNIFIYKITKCSAGKLCPDLKKCNYYHSLLERRRDPNKYFITYNKPCEKVFLEGKWTNPIECEKGDKCEYYHTRNELFYDVRNFRKIYECPNEKNEGECAYLFSCAYKHSANINANELYLDPQNKKDMEVLIQQYNSNVKEYDILKKRIEDNKLICMNCCNFIVTKMAVFNCGHICCDYCINKMNDCVFKCKRTNNDNLKSIDDYQIIRLNQKNNSSVNNNETILKEIEDDLKEEEFEFYDFSEDDEEFIDYSFINVNN